MVVNIITIKRVTMIYSEIAVKAISVAPVDYCLLDDQNEMR